MKSYQISIIIRTFIIITNFYKGIFNVQKAILDDENNSLELFVAVSKNGFFRRRDNQGSLSFIFIIRVFKCNKPRGVNWTTQID